MKKNTVRFYELDLLRFFAAMAVVLFHLLFRGQQGDYIPVTYPNLEGFAQYGGLGVNLFFMISGFVISLSAVNRSPKQFVVSRMARLYPAFWAGVTITAIAIVLFGGSLFQVSFSQYLVNLTMLAQFVGVEDIDGVYWTLYVELKFYAIIFLVLFFKQFHRIELILGAWLLILLLGLVVPYHRAVNALIFPEWSPYFISGVCYYLLKVKGFNPLRLGLLVIAFLLTLNSAVENIAIFNEDYNINASSYIAVSAVIIFHAIFGLILFNKLSWFRSSWAIKIGALTYPLYLIHENLGFMFMTDFADSFNKYTLLFIAIALLLLLSWLIHIIVEKKFGAILKKSLESILFMPAQLKKTQNT